MRLDDDAALANLLKANPALKVHGKAKGAPEKVEGRAVPVRGGGERKPKDDLSARYLLTIPDLSHLAAREWLFHDERNWRFDVAFPGVKPPLAVEIEGLVHGGTGRHQTVAGYTEDAKKYNAATLKGWRILRFTRRMIESGEAERVTREALR
jgi:hypothetical protein